MTLEQTIQKQTKESRTYYVSVSKRYEHKNGTFKEYRKILTIPMSRIVAADSDRYDVHIHWETKGKYYSLWLPTEKYRLDVEIDYR